MHFSLAGLSVVLRPEELCSEARDLKTTGSGWCFGTFFVFLYIGHFIIPINLHIFQRDVGSNFGCEDFLGVLDVVERVLHTDVET